jgi:transcriptional regulator GlxA family with amidase domain
MFGRHMRTTVTDYVMRLRLGEACALLSATDRPIAHVAADVGYDSLANFNRQFKALKAMTPRQYRRQFERVL